MSTADYENIGGEVLYKSMRRNLTWAIEFISGPDLMDRFEKQVEK